MLTMLFNAIMPLIMKAITVSEQVKDLVFIEQIVKMTKSVKITLLFRIE